ncbi:MAG: zinc ribbon domain-containing protein [Caldilineaceae bacterium]
MIICPHCGIRNRINSNFCNNCGADLRAESPSARPTPADESALAAGADEAASALPDESTAEAASATEADAEATGFFEDEAEIDDDLAAAYGFGDAEAGAVDDSLERLITGVQGLLPPHIVSSTAPDAADAQTDATPAPPPQTAITGLAEADLHSVRRLLSAEPVIINTPLELAAPQSNTLRIPWLFGLLGLFVLLAFLIDLPDLPGAPQPLPGVQEAYNQIEALPDNQLILVWWAYDPATAGEMDLITLPLLRHLKTRQSQLFLFSPLPTGAATAERLFARLDAEINLNDSAAMLRRADYLPGGPAVLPLIGQSLATAALDTTRQGRANANPAGALATPAQPTLVLVVAAQAEHVQDWLEQVQPRNHTPVVAITGAAADPVLRPYWDSGQLAGLVSGVDGGLAYDALLNSVVDTAAAPPRLSQLALGARHQMVQIQNWGHIGFALIILLGNLAILVHRR